jgi:hypothetical protein
LKRPVIRAIIPIATVAVVLLASLLAPRGVHIDPKLVACVGTGSGYGYAGGPPSVFGINPVLGKTPGGTSVQIVGQGFCGGGPTSAVSFGGTPASTFTVNSDTSLTATAPAHAGGVVDVTVTNTKGTSAISGASKFAYIAQGLYTLDGWGGIHADDSPAVASQSAYWPGWNIAGTAKPWPLSVAGTPQQGLMLDRWGGLHTYGPTGLAETSGASGHYWPGWDIARDFAFLPNGTGGFVLDGWGGLHGFGVNGGPAPTAVGNSYWPGWDIARKVVIFADGTGGFTLDAWGGLHPFGVNAATTVTYSATYQTGHYWPGWKIARDVALVPGFGGHAGYVLDGWGGLHPFDVTTDAGAALPPSITNNAYWPGWDIARGLWIVPGSSSDGYTLDGWGGPHGFGNAPAIQSFTYWPGWDIAKTIFGQ